MRCLNFTTSWVLLYLLAPVVCWADSPALPVPKVFVSQQGSTYFVMLPDRQSIDGGWGVAYRLEESGQSTELWRVKGWYAFDVYISGSGEYLVRMGNWARGMEPSQEDLAVTFYKRGIELGRYSTENLIKDKSSVKRSISHYMWQSNDSDYPRLSGNNKFYLKTIEGVEYEFDITTGKILGQIPPE